MMGEKIGRSFHRRFCRSQPPRNMSDSQPTKSNENDNDNDNDDDNKEKHVRSGSGPDIYVFRIGNVVEPFEYERDFKRYLMEVDMRKRNAWSYIDARELGRMCDLAIKKDGLGFQVSCV